MSATSPRVLLIEPYADSASFYAASLRAAGFVVENRIAVDTGEESATPGFTPDLVVVSVRRWDSASCADTAVPTIVLASYAEKGATAKAIGCAALLTLPVSPEVLVGEARGALSMSA